MAESDASQLVKLSKSVQAPTPKWHKTLKVRTPRYATPQGAKPTGVYTSTEKRRVGTASSSHQRHHHHERSTRDAKLEREDGDRFIPNRTLTDFNYASQQMLHGEEEKCDSDDEEPPKSMYEFGSSCKRKVKGKASCGNTGTSSTSFTLGIQPPSSGRSLSTSRKPRVVKDTRKVPAEPEKILDAPEVVDDFCKSNTSLSPLPPVVNVF